MGGLAHIDLSLIHISHIAAGGKVAVLIDAGVPPVCLVVDVVHQRLRHRDRPKLLEIQPSQGLSLIHI